MVSLLCHFLCVFGFCVLRGGKGGIRAQDCTPEVSMMGCAWVVSCREVKLSAHGAPVSLTIWSFLCCGVRYRTVLSELVV